MNENNEAVQILASEVKKCSKTIIENAKYDKTVKVRVIARLDQSNKYLVMIDGSEYEAMSYNTLSVNDICYATIIQNDYSQIIVTMPIYKSNSASNWELETIDIEI